MRFDPTTGAPAGTLIEAGVLVDPVSLGLGPDGALYVLDAAGLHRFDVETGAYLARVVAVADGQLARPRNFTFITDAELTMGP